MATMVPEVVKQAFWTGETKHGETVVCPADVFDEAGFREHCGAERDVERTSDDGFWARLQMPGYMDATDWMGPYTSEQEARQALQEAHDVCGRCGGEWDEGDEQGEPVCSECDEPPFVI